MYPIEVSQKFLYQRWIEDEVTAIAVSVQDEEAQARMAAEIEAVFLVMDSATDLADVAEDIEDVGAAAAEEDDHLVCEAKKSACSTRERPENDRKSI